MTTVSRNKEQNTRLKVMVRPATSSNVETHTLLVYGMEFKEAALPLADGGTKYENLKPDRWRMKPNIRCRSQD